MIINVYKIVFFIFVLKILIVVIVVGCGGISLCMIDSFVISGILIVISDILVFNVIVNINGINSINLIWKNIGIFIKNVMNIIV